MATSIRFTRIASRTNFIVTQLQGLQFAQFHPSVVEWRPNVNVYGFADRLEVCVELAGVPKGEIEIRVDLRSLSIRGRRASPEATCDKPPCGRVLLMEIPDGEFERVIHFEVDVDADRAEARQENGWLWVAIPFLNRA